MEILQCPSEQGHVPKDKGRNMYLNASMVLASPEAHLGLEVFYVLMETTNNSNSIFSSLIN